MPDPYEEVVSFRFPRDSPPPVSHVRSTLIAASLHGIRSRGWEGMYLSALPKTLHTEIQTLTAGTWSPLELAMQHYRACDAMGLDTGQMNGISEDVSLRTQKTFIGTLGKTFSGAGATPWLLLQNVHRIWDRMFQGADNAVYKVGPKEALVILVACPLVELNYFRVGVLGYYRALARILARVSYTKEVPQHRAPGEMGFRISWV